MGLCHISNTAVEKSETTLKHDCPQLWQTVKSCRELLTNVEDRRKNAQRLPRTAQTFRKLSKTEGRRGLSRTVDKNRGLSKTVEDCEGCRGLSRTVKDCQGLSRTVED
eukprot:9967425-Lingulodinium_polyedra.AAC.1